MRVPLDPVASTGPAGWSSIENVTAGLNAIPTTSYDHTGGSPICVEADSRGNIHVVWVRLHDGTYGFVYAQAFYCCRNVTTGTWSAALPLLPSKSMMAIDLDAPAMKLDTRGNVHFAFTLYNTTEGGMDTDIFYMWLNVTTGQLSPLVLVSINSSTASYFPTLAMTVLGNVHFMWCENHSDLHYRIYTSALDSWSMPVFFQGNVSKKFAMYIDSKDRWHVAWSDDLHVHYRAKNSGQAWQPIETLDYISIYTNEWAEVHFIKVDGYGRVHVVWNKGSSWAGIWCEFLHACKVFPGELLPAMNWTSPGFVIEDYLVSYAVGKMNDSITMDISREGVWHAAWSNQSANNLPNPDGSYNDVYYIQADLVNDTCTQIEQVSIGYFGDALSQHFDCTSSAIYFDDAAHIVWGTSGDDCHVMCYSKNIIPLDQPRIQEPVSNLVPDGIVTIRWDPMNLGTRISVYKSASRITSVDGMTPLPVNNGSSYFYNDTAYIDTNHVNGLFYYVIVASNLYTNSSLSNNLIIITGGVLPQIAAPVIAPITPSPDTDGTIQLNWIAVPFATVYYIYRDVTPFTEIGTRTCIAGVSGSGYTDIGLENGTYYYAIVAGNDIANSTLSGCQAVIIAIPLSPQNPGDYPGLDPVQVILLSVATGIVIGLLGGIIIARRRKGARTQASLRRRP